MISLDLVLSLSISLVDIEAGKRVCISVTDTEFNSAGTTYTACLVLMVDKKTRQIKIDTDLSKNFEAGSK